MVVQQEVSPPMSDRSPIWQHLYDCLESRSNLTAEDSQFKQILTELLAASSPIVPQRQEDRVFRLLAGDKLQLVYYWIRRRGITQILHQYIEISIDRDRSVRKIFLFTRKPAREAGFE
jgi:hypothetical protein